MKTDDKTNITRQQEEQYWLKIVSKDGMRLNEVNHQTDKICLAAVRNNGLALQFVRNQTPIICTVAILNNEKALLFVKHKTPEICKSLCMATHPYIRPYIKAFYELYCEHHEMQYLGIQIRGENIENEKVVDDGQ